MKTINEILWNKMKRLWNKKENMEKNKLTFSKFKFVGPQQNKFEMYELKSVSE